MIRQIAANLLVNSLYRMFRVIIKKQLNIFALMIFHQCPDKISTTKGDCFYRPDNVKSISVHEFFYSHIITVLK